jgi:hypothetical protein
VRILNPADGSVKMAGTADTGADSEVLPAERRRLLDEHPHLREPRPSRPTNGRLPLHGRYGCFIGLVVFWIQTVLRILDVYPGFFYFYFYLSRKQKQNKTKQTKQKTWYKINLSQLTKNCNTLPRKLSLGCQLKNMD